MKKYLIIVCFIFGVVGLKAESLVVSNLDTITLNGSSYDIPLAWGCILGNWFALAYPTKTNFVYTVSRGGEGWLGWYQNEEQKWGLPVWALGTSQVRNIYNTDDNGAYTSNNILTYGALIAGAPQLFYNGTASTNEGYNFPMTFLFTGNLIHDSSDGDSGAIQRNGASMTLNGTLGTPVIDQWHMLWTNGWNTDVVGSRRLGFLSSSHPYQGGLLASAITIGTALGMKTNFGGAIFDWSGVSATTNQCVVSSLTRNGNIMSCNIKFDCMPPGFQYQAGTISNDASQITIAMPVVANWLQWIIRGSNFVSANTYTIKVDSTTVNTLLGSTLNTGTNWVWNTIGPLWTQRQNVYFSYMDLYALDHTTFNLTHNAGSPGSLGVSDMLNYFSIASGFYDSSGHRGSQYVTDMTPTVNAVRTYTTNSYTLAAQTTHTLTITEVGTYQSAPFRP